MPSSRKSASAPKPANWRSSNSRRQCTRCKSAARSFSNGSLSRIVAREHLRGIDERAIALKDGRHVYVGSKGDYLDAHGRTLDGQDRDDAHALHQQNPKAATWAEKSDAEQQVENLRQLKERVQTLDHDAGKEDGKGLSTDELDSKHKDYAGRLSACEKEFQDQKEHRVAGIGKQVTDETYGGSDYMSAYEPSGRTTSYASTLDNANGAATLKKDFAPAAAGQGPKAPNRSVPQTATANPSPGSAPSA